jgi:hypothetical protein
MYSFLQPEIRKFSLASIILHKICSVGNITNKACFGQMKRAGRKCGWRLDSNVTIDEKVVR